MSTEQSSVEYREIQGFPGYRVGSDGSVWSCRKQYGLGPGRGSRPSIGTTWRLLKPDSNASGHLRVALSADGVKCRHSVHVLVLEAFVGPCPEGMQCRHFPDRDPANNRLENLQWGTCKENCNDKNIHKTMPRGSRHGLAKLTEEFVLQIRREYASGELNQYQLADKYHVDQAAISSVILRKTWTHI